MPLTKSASRKTPDAIVSAFHSHYFDNAKNVSWIGYPALKYPCDLWMYQELICLTVPEVIIETGTAYGGSALFMANVCDMIGQGEIITIDLEHQVGFRPGPPPHHRISLILGNSVDDELVAAVKQHVGNRTVMVILDSEHTKKHVLRELEVYAPMVSEGMYCIVEDTNVNGNPVLPDWGPGPKEAVDEYLLTHPEFQIDWECERFGMTYNPGGYLKKMSIP